MAIIRNIFKVVFTLLVLAIAARADDMAWYQTMLSEQVAPPYVAAYETLKGDILDPLHKLGEEMISENGTNMTTVLSAVLSATCGTKELYNNLTLALNASDDLNNQLEKKLLDLVSAVSQKENEIGQMNNQLKAIEAQLANSQTQVNNAQNDVTNKQNELNEADAQLAVEQDKVSKAKRCGSRKKRHWRHWRHFWRHLIHRIIKPICSLVNHGGIKHAREHRGAAQGAVNAAQEQLTSFQQQLQQLANQYANIQNQQSQLNAQLKSLSANLTQLQSRQAVLANITADIRKVIQHLSSFVSKVSVLYDELQDLVSFELLIEPLNEILTELIKNGVTVEEIAGASQISSVDIVSIKTTLGLLKSELPTLPLLDDYTNIC